MADHKHVPYLHAYAEDGAVEVWRCRGSLSVSEIVKDDQGNEIPGRTLDPTAEEHPYSTDGVPCNWEVKRDHDPKRFANERTARHETQEKHYASIAPKVDE